MSAVRARTALNRVTKLNRSEPARTTSSNRPEPARHTLELSQTSELEAKRLHEPARTSRALNRHAPNRHAQGTRRKNEPNRHEPDRRHPGFELHSSVAPRHRFGNRRTFVELGRCFVGASSELLSTVLNLFGQTMVSITAVYPSCYLFGQTMVSITAVDP